MLFQVRPVSMVLGLRLADGGDVVVKARPDDGRAASCVADAAAERALYPSPDPSPTPRR